jgi:hypothetical protein
VFLTPSAHDERAQAQPEGEHTDLLASRICERSICTLDT